MVFMILLGYYQLHRDGQDSIDVSHRASISNLAPGIVLWLLLCASVAFAAEQGGGVLVDVQGEVLLQAEGRYQPANEGMRVKDGQRLMILEGSRVKVVYDDGCEVAWTGARIVEIDMAACAGIAALWQPCMKGGVGAGTGDEIVLVSKRGTVLRFSDNRYEALAEGAKLTQGDRLRIEAEAEIDYLGLCRKSWQGPREIEIDPYVCPVAEVADKEGEATLTRGGKTKPLGSGEALLQGDRLELPEQAKVAIRYKRGCDEQWEGKRTVVIDLENCPLVAAVPGENCTPAIFGNLTPPDAVLIGTGVVTGVLTIPNNNPTAPPQPPVSP